MGFANDGNGRTALPSLYRFFDLAAVGGEFPCWSHRPTDYQVVRTNRPTDDATTPLLDRGFYGAPWSEDEGARQAERAAFVLDVWLRLCKRQ